MKRKLLVIFFIAVISSLLIYKNKQSEENILYIGEREYLDEINYKKYDKFLYDNITYKELINSIKNNDYITVKNKKIYLNQLISNADIIIIGANNIEYNKNCNNERLNMNYYNKKIENNKHELTKLLNKITASKIEILKNTCQKKN